MSDKVRGSDLLHELERPFEGERKRRRKGNRDLDYVPAQKVIQRLNDVLGLRWSSRVTETKELEAKTSKGKVPVFAHYCEISLRLDDGTEVVRGSWGGSPGASPDQIDTIKSGETDALKRAARLFGVALDIYGEDWEEDASVPPEDSRPATAPDARPEGRPEPAARPATNGPAPPPDEKPAADAPPDDEARRLALSEKLLVRTADRVGDRRDAVIFEAWDAASVKGKARSRNAIGWTELTIPELKSIAIEVAPLLSANK